MAAPLLIPTNDLDHTEDDSVSVPSFAFFEEVRILQPVHIHGLVNHLELKDIFGKFIVGIHLEKILFEDYYGKTSGCFKIASYQLKLKLSHKGHKLRRQKRS